MNELDNHHGKMTRRDFSMGVAQALAALSLVRKQSFAAAAQSVPDALPGTREVRIVNNAWVTMKDGVRLSVRITLPVDAERHPVPAVVRLDPYSGIPDPVLASYGYATICPDPRGIGNSEGKVFDEYAAQEQDDALDTLAWIARQKWCTGKTGMFGSSYSGFTALQVAARRPHSLAAIITQCASDDRYTDDAHYLGGCLVQDMFVWGSAWTGIPALKPDPTVVGPGWREMWLQRLQSIEFFVGNWLLHQQRDDFWKHGSVDENYAAIRCPVFAIGGWVDGYNNSVGRLMAHLKVPRKGLIGPWTHSVTRPGPAVDLKTEMRLWWDRWLKGRTTPADNDPLMRVYLQSEAFVNHKTGIAGRWVAEDQWPSPRIQSRIYHLVDDRITEQPGPASSRSIKTVQTVGICAPNWVAFNLDTEGPTDQRIDDGRSMTFDSAPLAEDFDCWGTPVLTLNLAVDEPVAFLAIRLNEVAAGGFSSRVTYQILNLCQRESREHPTPMEPGKRYSVRIPLRDLAYRFKKDHRIRIALSTTYWPLIWPSPDAVTLTVYPADSTLELPVRDARPEDATLRTLSASHTNESHRQTGASHDPFASEPYKPTRTFTWDPQLDKLTVSNRGIAGEETSEITDHDPTSARVTIVGNGLLRKNGENDVRTVLQLAVTSEDFLVTGEVIVKDNGGVVLQRKWDRKIRRNGL